MPQPNDRHSRSSWDGWSGMPARSQQRAKAAADDPVTPEKHGKNKQSVKKECKGAPDGRHVQEIVFRPGAGSVFSGVGTMPVTCLWRPAWDWKKKEWRLIWKCYHVRVCAQCDRVMGSLEMVTSCEFFSEEHFSRPAAEAELRERIAARERRASVQSRPVPDGPQGYRRPKGGKR